MPRYDFYCSKCKKTFEASVPMGTKSINCSHCNTLSEKKFSAPSAIIFKGSGFYKNDASKKKAAPKEDNIKQKQKKEPTTKKCCSDGKCHK